MKRTLMLCVFIILCFSTLLTASPDDDTFRAAETGNLQALKNAIKAGANVNKTKTMGSTSGLTPLMAAARFGHVEIAKTLLAAGANPNAQASDGFTALMLAACINNALFVKLLIQARVNVNASTPDGYTALRIASEKGYTEVVNILKAGGAR